MKTPKQSKKPDGTAVAQATLNQLGDRFTKILIGIAVLLVIGEFLIHRHGEFGFEDTFLFPAIYGFVAFLFIVQVGKVLRRLIMRGEDYYDR